MAPVRGVVGRNGYEDRLRAQLCPGVPVKVSVDTEAEAFVAGRELLGVDPDFELIEVEVYAIEGYTNGEPVVLGWEVQGYRMPTLDKWFSVSVDEFEVPC